MEEASSDLPARATAMNETTPTPFGWKDSGPQCAHEYLLPVLLEELRRRTSAGPMRIVDIGCGNGHVAARVAAMGHEVIGVDSAADGIEIARRAHPHIRFETVSVYEPRFEGIVDDPVDCVLALEVLEHLFDPGRLFAVSHALLREGGYLILSTPYHGYLKNLAISLVNGWDRHFGVQWRGGHIKFFSARTLSNMARQCGFERPRVRGAGRMPWLWKSMVMVAGK